MEQLVLARKGLYMRETIVDVKKILSKLLNVHVEDLQEDLISLGFSSILSISLIIELEDFYSIEIRDEDLLLENFKTLSNIESILKKYLNEVS